MASQSRYFKVTDQVLIEYKTDQYAINRLHTAGQDQTSFYMYIDNNNEQKLIEKSAISKSEYVLSDKSTMYYAGKDSSSLILSESGDSSIYGADVYANDKLVGTILKDVDGNEERSATVNRDTIRIYLITGYIMNNIAGYSVKVKAQISKVTYYNQKLKKTIVKRIDDTLTMLDWFMPKDELKDNIHWLTNPLYLNSKFYDRYIEIPLIAPLDAALHNPFANDNTDEANKDNIRDIDYVYEYTDEESGETYYFRGYPSQYEATYVEFATIQPDNMTLEKDAINCESTFTLDAPRIFTLMQDSNASMVNVRLYEDTDTHSIKYYPIYGDVYNPREFEYELMAAINSGAISMTNIANMDYNNDGIDDFIDMYGDDAFRWVIVNELSVSYVYRDTYADINGKDTPQAFNEYYTNTIDYTGKEQDKSEFWKNSFIPYIKDRENLTCSSIVITYNCHLFNRVNSTDIVRQASMVISDPYKYATYTINTDNIIKYKIVNKIEKVINTTTTQGTVSTPSYIREYYDTTNIVVKDMSSGNIYSQGKMVLKLYRTSSNYAFRLYQISSDNSRVPYNLAGNINYKIVFPSASSGVISIMPNKDSDQYNLQNGQLIFYISQDKAKAIMSVPASERYFAITTSIDGVSSEESTLYEGSVEWVSA